MPFVTEELWGFIPHEGGALIVAGWPQADESYFDEAAEATMVTLIDLVRGIRNVRDEYKVEPSRKISAQAESKLYAGALDQYRYLFSRLCNVADLQILTAGQSAAEQSATVVAGDVTVYLPLVDFVDLAAECERLNKEKAKLLEQIAKLQTTLGNEQFVSRAKPEVVERERTRLAGLQASADHLTWRLNGVGP